MILKLFLEDQMKLEKIYSKKLMYIILIVVA